ncbi:hypothetical protein EHS25_003659 [Saitozyma podzolica]|uniref:Amino acid transporter transmembrane domain-containing protein n=1 Tax=Saitozyma podzolica TaxID=1890683 RepID=A0A427Y7V6_9TREE|nr:hypothetical protein EHS25_003659 [Saitozyma podzolica]
MQHFSGSFSPRDSPGPGRQATGGMPIPTATSGDRSQGQVTKKRSKMMQSSLDLVFSYSRSQQMRYGKLGSAPSFVGTSRSFSSPDEFGSHRRRRLRVYDPESGSGAGPSSTDEESGLEVEGEDGELVEEDETGLYEEDEEGDEDEMEELEDGRVGDTRRSSGSPGLFPSDPVTSRRGSTETGLALEQSVATIKPSTTGGTAAGTTSDSRASPLLNIFSPTLPTAALPLSTSLATSFGTTSSASSGTPRAPSRRLAPDLTRQISQASVAQRRERERDGYVHRDSDQLFNAVAVLVGIGLLSLPLAFAYAGWIAGTMMLVGFAALTCHTAKLLARIIVADPSMLGYTDIGRRALGRWAGGAINVLFCLELFSLGVALIVLFGDSLNIVFPDISSNTWKLIGFIVILPTAMMPLRLLSIPSLLSTLSTFLLLLIILIDGLWKASPPGSLRYPAETSWFPEWERANWLGGVGLVLAGFGGHAVVPSLARDMKHPENFDKVINRAFIIATAVSFVAGAAGYLMIGNSVSDEITRDLMQDKYGYPRWLNLFATWMIVVNPLTKFGLCSRPLNVTIESLLGISPVIALPVDQIDRIDPAAAAESVISYLSPSSSRRPSMVPVPVVPARRPSVPARRPSVAPESTGLHSQPIPDTDPDTVSRHVHHTNTNTNTNPSSDLALQPEAAPKPSHSPSTLDMDIDVSLLHAQKSLASASAGDRRKAVGRIVSRTAITAACTAAAVGIPDFGKVMAFLGSFSAFLICVILPLVFYLRLAPKLGIDRLGTAGRRASVVARAEAGAETAVHWAIVAASMVLMVAGTAWAFVPGSGHGGLDA